MKIKTPIHDFLKNYNNENFTRCHIPGNKGRFHSNLSHDITEIHGADNLYDPCGIIAESEDTAAKIFNARKTLYSCSGSTLAIQTMLFLLKTAGGEAKRRIAAFRYAHRSFVSTAALLNFTVDWIYPDEFLSAKLKPESVKTQIRPDTAAVFLNSLDYYGGICDIKSISEICEKAEIPLLADNAHGAYLILTSPATHPISLGAAMSADSAHKTLPALTGAAYLHINTETFAADAKAAAALFGTTSPSYLVLESLDLCNAHIAALKKAGETEALRFVFELKQNLIEAGFSLKESDPLRITVNACDYGYTGVQLSAELRKNKVECEFADLNYSVLLFSTITEKTETEAVKAAFGKIARKKPLPPVIFPVLKPKQVMSIRDALFAPDKICAFLPPREAVGKVCACIEAPCPPGVPVIMPGEIIGAEEAALLKRFNIKNIRIIG